MRRLELFLWILAIVLLFMAGGYFVNSFGRGWLQVYLILIAVWVAWTGSRPRGSIR